MQVVVDIEDSVYHQIKQHGEISEFHKLIIHGTPLPKGHGRLVDADKTISKICGNSCGCHLEECGNDNPCYSVTRISSAQTIIEADKAEVEPQESEDKA